VSSGRMNSAPVIASYCHNFRVGQVGKIKGPAAMVGMCVRVERVLEPETVTSRYRDVAHPARCLNDPLRESTSRPRFARRVTGFGGACDGVFLERRHAVQVTSAAAARNPRINQGRFARRCGPHPGGLRRYFGWLTPCHVVIEAPLHHQRRTSASSVRIATDGIAAKRNRDGSCLGLLFLVLLFHRVFA
jgi:hypothetical protein